TIHVHCAARGLARRPLRPIFEAGRVTIQPFVWGFTSYQFAMLGVIEATVEGDEQKNALCPPIFYCEEDADYLTPFLALLTLTNAINPHPALVRWNSASRLNPMSGISSHKDDPRVGASRERVKQFGLAAAVNLPKLLSKRASSPR